MFPGTGCVLDGSHMKSDDFIIAVIQLAVESGFEIDHQTFIDDLAFLASEEDDEDRLLDIMNALDWTYEDALEYLNEHTRPGYVWVVRDQSLFLMTGDEADD